MVKPIKYAEIPATFDETKHYIEQLEPTDMGDYIFIDVVIKDLDLTETPMETHVEAFQPYVAEPTDKEKIANLETLVLELMGVV